MKSLYRLALTAVAVLASAAIVTAQTASGVVNKLEVQKLVAAGTPEANAALADHFTALADSYTADAARHTDMAKAYSANPVRSVATSSSPHCTRLAEIATESATAAREMAAYHQQLAGGNAGTSATGCSVNYSSLSGLSARTSSLIEVAFWGSAHG